MILTISSWIIESYKLSTRKIKAPHRLYIVYKKRDDFSLDKIGKAEV